MPVAFATSATRVPEVAFIADSGMLVSASFQLLVYVLPPASWTGMASWLEEDGTVSHSQAGEAQFEHVGGAGSLQELEQAEQGWQVEPNRDLQKEISSRAQARDETAGGCESLEHGGNGLQGSGKFDEGLTKEDILNQALQRGGYERWQHASLSHFKQDDFQDGKKVQVAHLRANASLLVNAGFARADMLSVDIRFETVESRYNVTAAHWDQTVQWVLKEARDFLGLQALYKEFIGKRVRAIFEPQNVVSRYRAGWYQVSGDVHVNASSISLAKPRTSDAARM